jgi:hypothetical protein
MNYNYNDLFNFLNVQQKKIKDVITEAQQALEALEFNRHLLERHMQITLRLHEITTRLEIINSRMEEIKDDQRLFNLGLQIQPANPPQIAPATKNNGEKHLPPQENFSAPLSDQPTVSLKPEGKTTSPLFLTRNPQNSPANQSQIIQLEIVELSNQQVKLKNQKNHFEMELSAIEKQLTDRGIGAIQG